MLAEPGLESGNVPLIRDQFDGPFLEFVREFSAYRLLHVNTSKEHPKRSYQCPLFLYQVSSLRKRIEDKHGVHTMDHAEALGIGRQQYTLVGIDA